MHKNILDAGIATAATATTQVANSLPLDWTPIIVGVIAPILKEALFKLIDKIGKNRKAKNG